MASLEKAKDEVIFAARATLETLTESRGSVWSVAWDITQRVQELRRAFSNLDRLPSEPADG